MQMEIRPAAARGQANHGWLYSQHSFSFAHYYDRRHMGFGPLRVINEDKVAPGRGFLPHHHQSMEILSYVISGALEHKDTLGNGSVIRPGEVQLMSAGRGIQHSEMNGSTQEEVHFLQIWILPRSARSAPRYDQRLFEPTPGEGLRLVVSPTGREGSLRIDQDMDLHRLLLDAQGQAQLDPRGPRAWVQVIKGSLQVNGAALKAGDGLAIEGAEQLSLSAGAEGVEALVFDLP
ncbi:MAG: pirin family protein [Myxococcota bacterium]|nr:pirin family protein [Myxococcota bacterium]